MRRCLVLLLLLSLCVWAEDPPNPQVAVLDPATGRVLGHYLLMRSVQLHIENGTEDPHFPYLQRFCLERRVDPHKPLDQEGKYNFQRSDIGAKAFMGLLPNGDKLMWFVQKATQDGGRGPLKVVDGRGRQRVLLKNLSLSAPGWRPLFRPGLCTAGPFLLAEEPAGVSCRRIADGHVLWRARWKFGHCRWNLGAWYTGGFLYLDTTDGLSRVEPYSGRVLWTWPEAVELLDVAQYPDGRLYAEFQYGPRRALFKELRAAAADRYHWPDGDDGPWPRVIPYKDLYFGATWYRPGGDSQESYLKEGKVAIWEYRRGRWSWIFDYDCTGTTQESLEKLFARNGFSLRMSQQLTTDSLSTVYRDRTGKMLPAP